MLRMIWDASKNSYISIFQIYFAPENEVSMWQNKIFFTITTSVLRIINWHSCRKID